MSIIDTMISSLVPHTCLSCGYEGVLVCANCAKSIKTIWPRCYRCRQPSRDFKVCDRCKPTSSLHAIYTVATYEGSVKDLLWQLKFQSTQAAAGVMADFMAPLMDGASGAWLVPVPTASKRARTRGYDQAKLLARKLSRYTRLPYVDCLRRSGQTHQVGATRDERMCQLQNSFRFSGSVDASQKIILVDDVVTTGATLEAAAAACTVAGAVHISAVTFAQPNALGDLSVK